MNNSLKQQLLRLGGVLLPGLASLIPSTAGAMASPDDKHSADQGPDGGLVLRQGINNGTYNMYAGHRSHSSHSSHRSHSSHASHSSGSGGYPAAPPPPPSEKPAEASPKQPAMKAPAGNPRPQTDELKQMIMRVQLALLNRGYDPGAIDGELNSGTTNALMNFQIDKNIQANGRLTTETLSALGIQY